MQCRAMDRDVFEFSSHRTYGKANALPDTERTDLHRTILMYEV